MNYDEVDRRYAELRRQYIDDEITSEQFDERLRDLMIKDEDGKWWAKSKETGAWNYHDGSRWVAAEPPRNSSTEPQVQPEHHPGGDYGSSTHVPAQSVSSNLAILFYAVALFFPVIGAVLWFVYRSKPAPGDQAIARNVGILTLIGFSLLFLLCVCIAFASLAGV